MSALVHEEPDVPQGSAEWIAARVGRYTASNAHMIFHKGQGGKPSKMRQTYLVELATERLTGEPAPEINTPSMEYGFAMEVQAREAYEVETGALVQLCSFIEHPTIPMSGASPDGLVNADGVWEGKCLNLEQHVALLLGGEMDADHAWQCHWQLACTGRAWCDYTVFNPRMPEGLRLYVKRIHRDEALLAQMQIAVRLFLADVDALEAKLRALIL